MNRVLNAWWYSPWTGNLDIIGIVKVMCHHEIKFYIGTAKGENEAEDIESIVNYGTRFYPEVFKGEINE